ncbi:MAG: hypothetical protein RIR96_785 [Bacteroidota bacterium]|jgi:hypothetical protein
MIALRIRFIVCEYTPNELGEDIKLRFKGSNRTFMNGSKILEYHSFRVLIASFLLKL